MSENISGVLVENLSPRTFCVDLIPSDANSKKGMDLLQMIEVIGVTCHSQPDYRYAKLYNLVTGKEETRNGDSRMLVVRLS